MRAAVLVALALCVVLANASKPNIVFILTDDQDLLLGGADHMPNLQALVAQPGATMTNFFTSTPVCCPSRSSILTGRHLHNIGVRNNSIEGNCSSPYWQRTAEPAAFAPLLQRAGYRTMFAGKYLNMYGSPRAGGTAHVPPGWSRWVGLVGNSIYYDYTLSIDGKAEKHGDVYASDYLTDLVANHSIAFLKEQKGQKDPFFLMVSPPSCHDPTEAAPQHAHAFENVTAPRPPSFGAPRSGQEWFVSKVGNGFPMSDPNRQHYIDLQYGRRLATLLSVDDMIGRIVSTLTETGQLNSTYIVFTSDNGYHLGEFGLLKDKRLPYEFDIHVPAFARGPDIPPFSVVTGAVLNVDLFPTFLDMAGLSAPPTLDGVTALPLLRQARTLGEHARTLLPSQLREALARQEVLAEPPSPPRVFLVEYFGESGGQGPPVCHSGGPDVSTMECYPEGPEMARVPPHYTGPTLCSCQDVRNNTYRCARHVAAEAPNYIYCEFYRDYPTENPQLAPYHKEFYDLTSDPWQLTNTFDRLAPSDQAKMGQLLAALASCHGESCYRQAA